MDKIIIFIKKHFLGIFLLIYFFLLIFNINSVYLFIGDEKRYSESVSALLDGYIDTNNHPLLAKTIWVTTVFISYSVFGTDKPIFWRIGTIILSILTLYVFYKIARLLFPKNIAFFAPVILALDPMFFVFSRLIQLDVPTLFFSLTSVYFFLLYIKRADLNSFLKGSLFLGLSNACKLSGLGVALILPFFLLIPIIKKRKFLEFVLLLMLFYMGVTTAYIFGNFIFLIYSDFDITGFFQYTFAIIQDQIFNSRLRMAEIEKTYQVSKAWTWFLIPQILSMYRLNWGKTVEAVVVLQNPATFIISAYSILKSLTLFLNNKTRESREFGLLILFLAANYLPWFFQVHPTFYYYVIPLTPVVILLFLQIVSSVKKAKSFLVLFSFLNLFFFVLYFPLLIAVNVPKNYDLFFYKYSQLKYPEFNWPVCQNCTPRK